MSRLINISAPVLKNIASGSKNIPTMYYHPFAPIQKLFWLRLAMMTNMMKERSGVALDFGGGGGVFLPTLSVIFKKVICLDLCVKEAEMVVEMYGLSNVEIVQGDALKIEFDKNCFDVVVAADVLEHFIELQPPIERIHRWLKLNGSLFISGPSENWLYRFGRTFFHIKKPEDHYHSVKDIENLVNGYFMVYKKKFLPWFSSFSPIENFAVFTIIEARKLI